MGYFRHPKTTQEIRNNEDEWVDGYFIPIRGHRKNLPTLYDDYPVDHEDRCWKNFRDKQYNTVNKFDTTKLDSSNYSNSMKNRDHLLFEHRWCKCKSRRCNYCIKHNLWNRIDKEYRRIRRNYLLGEIKEVELWYHRNGYSLKDSSYYQGLFEQLEQLHE